MAAGAERVVVIGAGIGGLVAALLLASRGLDVTVLERADAPGGKMREVALGTRRLDAGPTVLTLRGVLDEIFAEAGACLSDHLTLRRAGILARHAWDDGPWLDLHADPQRSAAAIGAFAGPAEARGFLDFCAKARRVHETLDRPFMRAQRPGPLSLTRTAGVRALLGIGAFTTLWRALGEHFRDPRLRQLFGRYSTYCGSSPFQAPATLMLVAHVEACGVWLVEGGMHRIARALADLAAARGARFRYGAPVADITVERGRATGVVLADGERVAAGAVLCNADAAALADGLLGTAASAAVAPVPARARSLSALTWAMVAQADGFPLHRHSVFFSPDYAAEFRNIAAGRLPTSPTIYVCAQDRDDAARPPPGSAAERLFCIVNAPATGDTQPPTITEIEACRHQMLVRLERCGLRMRGAPALTAMAGPAEFAARFPGTGGALYGRASHGWAASFQRPGARTRLPRLFLAGGSAHPGPGVPMAALSGQLAAAAVIEDLVSTSTSRRRATAGGTSMR